MAKSKAQFLNEIHTHLKKHYKPKPDRGGSRLSVLEAVVYAVCHEGTTREQANQALSRFKDEFFDWNEVRVSTIEEIQSALAGLPDTESRANKIRRFLRQLFEKTYAFDLDALVKKPLKESLKVLSEYEVFASDYVTASVVQLALGGHAIPVDEPCRRALRRLGIAEPEGDHTTLRSLLERAVPKNRGAEFVDLLEDLAHDTCVIPEPDCPRCDLRKICPTGLARKEEAHVAAKQAAARARAAAKVKVKEKDTPKAQTKAAPTPAPAPPPASPPPAAKAAAKPSKPAAKRRGGGK
jgi:endonuclease III